MEQWKNLLNLILKLAQVNRLFLRSLRLEAGLQVRFNHKIVEFARQLCSNLLQSLTFLEFTLDPFDQKDEEQESFSAVRRRPNLADPRKKA